jgi:hypothetical protein
MSSVEQRLGSVAAINDRIPPSGRRWEKVACEREKERVEVRGTGTEGLVQG